MARDTAAAAIDEADGDAPMAARSRLTVIGLMSGTSMDGIDAAVLVTDGERVSGFGPSLSMSYDNGFRDRLRAILGRDPVGDRDAGPVAAELTLLHADAIERLFAETAVERDAVDLIGFPGHTVLHRPADGITRQIGDARALADRLGIPVVGDFRSADVAAGGEGAPLAPLYHAALAEPLDKPVAVLNLGGVANVTWISRDGAVIAFDTGPGNALIDDWTRHAGAGSMDADGRLAHAGRVDEKALAGLLDNPYFDTPYPKSLDRHDFGLDAVMGLDATDGAATLTAFTAAAVERAAHLLPAFPERWLVTGGGRHNPALMAALRSRLVQPVEPVEIAGWRGDALEAQAFAYLAARSVRGLPLSLPTTTGVREPMPGGVLYEPGDGE